MRLAPLVAVLAGVGAALVLAELPWFRRPDLTARLRPHVAPTGAPPAAGVAGVLAPVASELGGRVARLLGNREPLGLRLRRVHSPTTAGDFRVAQLGAACAALAVVGAVVVVLPVPGAVAVTAVVALPAVVFLAPEHRLSTRSLRWQHQLTRELPVAAEQIGMLLAAGWSLSGALGRLAERGNGAVATDLARVVRRTRQGLSVEEALREWALTADVPAVSRLVTILSMNRETSDLGRMIAAEARSMRRELHRQVLADIERRSQLVWIPVTVAALVPGVILIGVPFIEALRLFSVS